MIAPYYQDGSVTLYHGDCRRILPLLEAGSVEHVITDPPYSEHVHGKSRAGSRAPKKNGRGAKAGCSIARTVDFGFGALTPSVRKVFAAECARLARRWVLAFSDVESAHLMRDAFVGAGLEHVRTGIWEKEGATPQFTGDRPAAAVETVTIAHGVGDLERVLAELGAEAREVVVRAIARAAGRAENGPCDSLVITHPRGRKRWNGGGQHAIWRVPIALNRDKATPRYHPTEKPLPLMLRLVEQFTEPGDLILDPFSGSGTTGVAAKMLGRRAILVEQAEEHCKTAVERLRQEMLPMSPRTGEGPAQLDLVAL